MTSSNRACFLAISNIIDWQTQPIPELAKQVTSGTQGLDSSNGLPLP
jgi:hypothetical protein